MTAGGSRDDRRYITQLWWLPLFPLLPPLPPPRGRWSARRVWRRVESWDTTGPQATANNRD